MFLSSTLRFAHACTALRRDRSPCCQGTRSSGRPTWTVAARIAIYPCLLLMEGPSTWKSSWCMRCISRKDPSRRCSATNSAHTHLTRRSIFWRVDRAGRNSSNAPMMFINLFNCCCRLAFECLALNVRGRCMVV